MSDDQPKRQQRIERALFGERKVDADLVKLTTEQLVKIKLNSEWPLMSHAFSRFYDPALIAEIQAPDMKPTSTIVLELQRMGRGLRPWASCDGFDPCDEWLPYVRAWSWYRLKERFMDQATWRAEYEQRPIQDDEQ